MRPGCRVRAWKKRIYQTQTQLTGQKMYRCRYLITDMVIYFRILSQTVNSEINRVLALQEAFP